MSQVNFKGVKTRSMSVMDMPPPRIVPRLPPHRFEPPPPRVPATSASRSQSFHFCPPQQIRKDEFVRILPPPANIKKRKTNHCDCSKDNVTNCAEKNNRSESHKSNNDQSKNDQSNHFSAQFPTELQTFHASDHGNIRRFQRDIGIREIQAAKKYGTRKPGVRKRNGDRTTMYEYKGICYIENDRTRKEITSYRLEVPLESKTICFEDNRRHSQALKKIEGDRSTWISHSVCVVDTSGSMRNADVKGCRTRLKAVWHALAVDFVQHRIESGEATDMDIVTIITMGEKSEVFLYRHPTNWILFNILVKLFHGQRNYNIRPAGHGYFLPALAKAEEILFENKNFSCVLTLAMFTDGRPSDRQKDRDTLIQKKIESLSSRIGKRFTVATIGIGSAAEFETLKEMANTAKDFGSEGLYQVPSLSRDGLGTALSSIATSVAATRTAMTMLGEYGQKGLRMKTVRKVLRERLSTIPAITEEVDPSEFHIYTGNKVIHKVYDPSATGSFKDAPLLHPGAAGVAVCKKAFGEGTERIVYQFFEITSDGRSVAGGPLVAKESRFLEDYGKDEVSKEKYVRKFCNLQYTSKKAAEAFNQKLDSFKILHKDTARVSFLDCSAYYLDRGRKGEQLLLVEKRLHQNFQKWNNNNGGIFVEKGSSQEVITIDEDEDDEVQIIEDDEVEIVDMNSTAGRLRVTPAEVAQAFSHFSYTYSSEKYLICDLQGSYDKVNRMFHFTDPVIHYHDKQKCNKTNVFGRTDRGKKGIDSFLETHRCNALCALLNKGLKNHR